MVGIAELGVNVREHIFRGNNLVTGVLKPEGKFFLIHSAAILPVKRGRALYRPGLLLL